MNNSISGVNITRIYSLNISFSDQIDALQVTYLLSNGSFYSTPNHGSGSKSPTTIFFSKDEHITKIEGQTNEQLINQLTITTQVGPDYEHKVYGPFGKNGTLSFTIEGYMMGFYGRSSDVLNTLGVYSLEPTKKSEEYGGSGGNPFDDRVDGRAPPVVGIGRILIWHHNIISGIQVEYKLLGGETVMGEKHGSPGNDLNQTTITFDEGEELKEVQGQVGEFPTFVHQLTFVTRKEGGGNAQYGPFGKSGVKPFSLTGEIYGFIGSSGTQIDRIGVYYL